MADPLDVALTIVGWIVASIVAAVVTIWGVRYAHRKEVESQQAHEDELTLYQPLFLEVQRITENRRSLPYGNQLWVQTDTFGMLKMRLLPERHKQLREAVAELERRYAIHDSSARAFDSALSETIQSTMNATPIHSTQLSPRMLSDVLGGGIDVALRNGLASGDVDPVRARFIELVNE